MIQLTTSRFSLMMKLHYWWLSLETLRTRSYLYSIFSYSIHVRNGCTCRWTVCYEIFWYDRRWKVHTDQTPARKEVKSRRWSDMLPPLKSQILKWGLLAQWLYWAKYLQAILACPAIFCPDTGVFSYLFSGHGQLYAASILLASSRMLIAAFRSLSISFPHEQR